jgi:hypothetical protein
MMRGGAVNRPRRRKGKVDIQVKGHIRLRLHLDSSYTNEKKNDLSLVPRCCWLFRLEQRISALLGSNITSFTLSLRAAAKVGLGVHRGSGLEFAINGTPQPSQPHHLYDRECPSPQRLTFTAACAMLRKTRSFST